jgi:hypothetical protein
MPPSFGALSLESLPSPVFGSGWLRRRKIQSEAPPDGEAAGSLEGPLADSEKAAGAGNARRVDCGGGRCPER